ncbi:hypothetical protein [Agrobacterium radiobacter]|uniref:hypothetical protein n=2 Tax=Agrobacterium radiobacter TaxID=362 RepID=UPI003CE48A6A
MPFPQFDPIASLPSAERPRELAKAKFNAATAFEIALQVCPYPADAIAAQANIEPDAIQRIKDDCLSVDLDTIQKALEAVRWINETERA